MDKEHPSVTELCPYCGQEVTIDWDVDEQGLGLCTKHSA